MPAHQSDSTSDDFDFAAFLKWKDNPVTQKLNHYMRELRRDYNQQILHSELRKLGELGKCIGSVNILDRLLELDFEQLNS